VYFEGRKSFRKKKERNGERRERTIKREQEKGKRAA